MAVAWATDWSEIGVIAILVTAPIAIVIIVLLLRGYDVDLRLGRKPGGRWSRDREPPDAPSS